jgi:phasin
MTAMGAPQRPRREKMSSKKAKIEMTNEIPANVTAFAQKSVDQAQAAFEKANDLAHSNVQVFDAAFGAYKSRFADLQLKAMELTQTNMNAAFAFARKALSVKEPTEFFAIQQDYVKDQFQVAQKQVTELNELAVALAKETVKPVQEGLTKSFGEVTKSYAA